MTQLYIEPERSNVLGEPNVDAAPLQEFTFNHGHVEKALNLSTDLNSYPFTVYGSASNLSQCVVFTRTYDVTISPMFKKHFLARPLLRGISDSITRGDAIIFTEIPRGSGKYYYMGPLNVTNNPNSVPDDLYNLSVSKINQDRRKDKTTGANVNYIEKKVNKASKDKNVDLDRPYDIGIGQIGSDADEEANVTDLVLEGRYSNSIRFGSRFVNPYTIIGNNNGSGTNNSNNGSILGMLSFGKISDYFSDFTQLSSDKVVKKEGYIGFPIGAGNDNVDDENKFKINFGEVQEDYKHQTEFDQIIMFSDRITFDAQKNDFTVSAFRNINFGAGKNFTLTNKGYSVFESKNIYIGKGAKQRSQPMVLGEELRRLLVSILRLINDSRALVQGVPIPLVKQDSTPLLADITNIMQEFRLGTMPAPGAPIESPASEYNTQMTGSNMEIPLGDRTLGGATFFSNHHFIETNRS